MKITIGGETFRTTQELVERIVTLDEGNGVLLDRIRELESSIVSNAMVARAVYDANVMDILGADFAPLDQNGNTDTVRAILRAAFRVRKP